MRLLGSGRGSKNDPNDALSTAIAALRDPHLRTVIVEDHAMVLRLLADRHQDLTSLRTQAVCRLHALIAALTPGGVQRRLSADCCGISAADHPPDQRGRGRSASRWPWIWSPTSAASTRRSQR